MHSAAYFSKKTKRKTVTFVYLCHCHASVIFGVDLVAITYHNLINNKSVLNLKYIAHISIKVQGGLQTFLHLKLLKVIENETRVNENY